MKYLAILLLLTACSSARIVKAPPDGRHIPVTVECNVIADCAELLEHTCGHNHYKINHTCAARQDDKDIYLVDVTCNP